MRQRRKLKVGCDRTTYKAGNGTESRVGVVRGAIRSRYTRRHLRNGILVPYKRVRTRRSGAQLRTDVSSTRYDPHVRSPRAIALPRPWKKRSRNARFDVSCVTMKKIRIARLSSNSETSSPSRFNVLLEEVVKLFFDFLIFAEEERREGQIRLTISRFVKTTNFIIIM